MAMSGTMLLLPDAAAAANSPMTQAQIQEVDNLYELVRQRLGGRDLVSASAPGLKVSSSSAWCFGMSIC